MNGVVINTSYPRPDFVRDPCKWQSLNGEWSFAFDEDDMGRLQEWCLNGIPKEKLQKIQVPFVYQTPASGINVQAAKPIVWYQMEVSADQSMPLPDEKQYRTILRFGAVDYEAHVFLDGHLLGTHRGGHTPFSFDITGRLDENRPVLLTVRVWDAAHDLTQPRGKQYWEAKPKDIFYTPSTGIWQGVWLETVPPEHIADSTNGTVIKSNDIDTGRLHCVVALLDRQKSKRCYMDITASLAGIEVAKSPAIEVDREKDVALIDLGLRLTEEQQSSLPKTFKVDHWHNGVALWSPENPVIYDLNIKLWRDPDRRDLLDQVNTYTGMRSVSWTHGDATFRLNGRPYFHALVLDQGYWPETNMTPPNSESCKNDILLAKSMGFNGCRKHQKVESPEFLYWADRLGYMVWGEMANAYEFCRQYIDRFDAEWCEAVRRDLNHPSVVCWTPVNETWGYTDLANDEMQQMHIRSLYFQTKSLDLTRPINDNCGWEHVCTDLTTFHDYADSPQLAETCSKMSGILNHKAGRAMFVAGSSHVKGVPVLCTEFGGVNIALKKGEQGIDGEWGYTTATDSKDLLDRVRKLMMAVVKGGHCCGFVYTQLTDIEQETNGLYTYNREEKLPPHEMKKIIDEVCQCYYRNMANGI